MNTLELTDLELIVVHDGLELLAAKLLVEQGIHRGSSIDTMVALQKVRPEAVKAAMRLQVAQQQQKAAQITQDAALDRPVNAR
jgi:hypothetical protein